MKRIDNEIQSIRKELEELRAAVKDRRNLHTAEKCTIEKRRKDAEYAFQMSNKKFNQNQGHFAYLQYVKKSRENDTHFVVPPTILSFEAQLCRSVHQMCVMKNQLNLASKHSVVFAEALQEGLNRVEADLSSAEIITMNKIMEKDANNKAIATRIQSELQRVQDETSKIELAISRVERERIAKYQHKIYKEEMGHVESELAEIENSFSSLDLSHNSSRQGYHSKRVSPISMNETGENSETSSSSSDDYEFRRILKVVGQRESQQLKKKSQLFLYHKVDDAQCTIPLNGNVALKMQKKVPLSA
mmetsp:Transcript_16675/g.23501  ORF Transcript_16675/g.23501 Transcript_16675/m.23501 type:complete len:302 (+) Transcript_16675:75-980(+)